MTSREILDTLTAFQADSALNCMTPYKYSTWTERDHQRHREVQLEDALVRAYVELYRLILESTTQSIGLDELKKRFALFTNRWVDSELRVLGEAIDLDASKQLLIREFSKLVNRRKSDGFRGIWNRLHKLGRSWGKARQGRSMQTNEGTARCPFCDNPCHESVLLHKPSCQVCATPVIRMLDTLVRSSTKRFTPNQLIRKYFSEKAEFNQHPEDCRFNPELLEHPRWNRVDYPPPKRPPEKLESNST